MEDSALVVLALPWRSYELNQFTKEQDLKCQVYCTAKRNERRQKKRVYSGASELAAKFQITWWRTMIGPSGERTDKDRRRAIVRYTLGFKRIL